MISNSVHCKTFDHNQFQLNEEVPSVGCLKIPSPKIIPCLTKHSKEMRVDRFITHRAFQIFMALVTIVHVAYVAVETELWHRGEVRCSWGRVLHVIIIGRVIYMYCDIFYILLPSACRQDTRFSPVTHRVGSAQFWPIQFLPQYTSLKLSVHLMSSLLILLCLYQVLHFKVEGWEYLHDVNQIFNFLMAMLSWITDLLGVLAWYSEKTRTLRDITQVLGAFRVLRVILLFGDKFCLFVVIRGNLFSLIVSIYNLSSGFFYSLISLAWITTFLFIVIFAFANLATRFFQGVLNQVSHLLIQFKSKQFEPMLLNDLAIRIDSC